MNVAEEEVSMEGLEKGGASGGVRDGEVRTAAVSLETLRKRMADLRWSAIGSSSTPPGTSFSPWSSAPLLFSPLFIHLRYISISNLGESCSSSFGYLD